MDNKEGLELLKTAIANAGYTAEIEIGMDVAASEFCKDKKYDLDFKNPNSNPDDWVSNSCCFILSLFSPSSSTSLNFKLFTKLAAKMIDDNAIESYLLKKILTVYHLFYFTIFVKLYSIFKYCNSLEVLPFKSGYFCFIT